MIRTYIVETKSAELYCGKAVNLEKRLELHRKEKYPNWFNNDLRREFILIFNIEGDFEREIKKFGVRRFIKCLSASRPPEAQKKEDNN